MASTFSPTLRIELIGDGDQSGIWGQTTNTNLGTLLEQAITGVVSITMVDANYTLTNFNGVSDESRNAVLVAGGTNAAVRDIIAPLVEKLYVVKNSTSGGFAINIRAASGSSVSVPSGATVWVYCDGTNFNAINTESVGNFEVNGNLTVTGNTNAVAATYTGNVAALNISTANVTATGAGAFTGNVSAANFSTAGNATATNFIGAGLTITSINASNISAGTIANARTTAASANGASTIVARDSNGSFSANVGTFVTVSGAHSGNGAGLTDINASNISSGTISNARTTAASANGASTIVARDSSGNFTANAITTTSISGNGVALTAINASNITSGTISNARTTADSANGASTIVARDSSGNFTANAVTTTSISGNGVALTAINASNISSGTVASARIAGSYTGITGVGTLTAGTWNATTIAVANGGTGVTSSTGTGSTVLSASPTFTGAPLAPTASVTTDNTQIATTEFVRNIIPAGIISMWSGSIVSIPSGWVLCDGTNSTPDLRDRFVVGAGSTYAVAATGGSANAVIVSHTHTATSTDAGHTHVEQYNGGTPGSGDGICSSGVSVANTPSSASTATGFASITTTVASAGVSGTNANLPPYYALAYIMKT
jgi:hypothetical protein